MDFKIGRFIIMLVLGAWGLSSCTVKEERPGCPAWLSVVSEGSMPDGIGGDVVFRVYRNDVMELDQMRTRQEFEDGFEIRILRGALTFVGVYGWPLDVLNADGLVIPYGTECPMAWGFSDDVLLEKEEEVIREAFRMLYANMHVSILGVKDGEYSYFPTVAGNVDGYTLSSFRPHLGEFRCFMRQASARTKAPSTGEYELRVPRQVDDSLEFLLLEDNRTLKDPAAYVLPIGKVLRENGYDWNARVLEDIYIVIDYVRARIQIKVADWTVVVLMTSDNGKFKI